MSTSTTTYRLCVWLLVISLLLSSSTPVALAQTGDIYLPFIANGAGQPATDLLFRTHVTVQTTAQWRDLERMEVVILAKEANAALLLVDDLQLETLARLRYNPEATNSIETLAATHAGVQTDFSTLLSQLPTFQAQLATADLQPQKSELTAAARQSLRTAMHALRTEQLVTLAQAAGVDSDSDGLSDDLEGYWCTNAHNTDSDADGSNDEGR